MTQARDVDPSDGLLGVRILSALDSSDRALSTDALSDLLDATHFDITAEAVALRQAGKIVEAEDGDKVPVWALTEEVEAELRAKPVVSAPVKAKPKTKTKSGKARGTPDRPRGEIKPAILALLHGNPGRDFSTVELAAQTNASATYITKVLHDLPEADLVAPNRGRVPARWRLANPTAAKIVKPKITKSFAPVPAPAPAPEPEPDRINVAKSLDEVMAFNPAQEELNAINLALDLWIARNGATLAARQSTVQAKFEAILAVLAERAEAVEKLILSWH